MSGNQDNTEQNCSKLTVSHTLNEYIGIIRQRLKNGKWFVNKQVSRKNGVETNLNHASNKK